MNGSDGRAFSFEFEALQVVPEVEVPSGLPWTLQGPLLYPTVLIVSAEPALPIDRRLPPPPCGSCQMWVWHTGTSLSCLRSCSLLCPSERPVCGDSLRKEA